MRDLLGVQVRERGSRRRANEALQQQRQGQAARTKRPRLEETPPKSDDSGSELAASIPKMGDNAATINCEMCGGLGPEWTQPTAAVSGQLCYCKWFLVQI